MRCSVFITFISNLRIDSELINIFQEFIKEYKQNSGKSTSPIKLVKYYSKRNKNYSIVCVTINKIFLLILLDLLRVHLLLLMINICLINNDHNNHYANVFIKQIKNITN